jgi:hypothetical protein
MLFGVTGTVILYFVIWRYFEHKLILNISQASAQIHSKGLYEHGLL